MALRKIPDDDTVAPADRIRLQEQATSGVIVEIQGDYGYCVNMYNTLMSKLKDGHKIV